MKTCPRTVILQRYYHKSRDSVNKKNLTGIGRCQGTSGVQLSACLLNSIFLVTTNLCQQVVQYSSLDVPPPPPGASCRLVATFLVEADVIGGYGGGGSGGTARKHSADSLRSRMYFLLFYSSGP